MDYKSLLSHNRPAEVDVPAGLKADTKYIFSVTNAVPEFIDVEKYSTAARDVVLREGKDLAPYPPPNGHEGLRRLIAENLRDNRSADVDIDSVLLTDGAGGFIRMYLDAFIDPGDVVFVEEFSYLGTLRLLLSKRAEVVHIPTDEQGMNTEELERAIKAVKAQGKTTKLIYAISVYQNPMGVTLSEARRKHMVKIAQDYGVPILENESYADFRIDGDPLPPSMLSMDDQDAVVYVSSYTKLLGCALRLGYGVAPLAVQELLQPHRPSHLAGMMVYEYLRYHKDDHIERVSKGLMARRDALLSALEQNFPPSCTWTKPTGGMMLWVQLPEGADTWKALDHAVDADVKYNPGGVFRADRGCNNYLRLTYSHNTPEEIHEGIKTLAEVFRQEGFFE
ncbi:MAG: PLP-dependent aminotransferase family protein [SAR202 cluster bacterium]|nr:PLP-dependent aminotransferase family protein [SAR202 cluster bacterium]